MVSGNQALVELILRDVGLDGSNVDLLAEAIDKGKNLTYLDISSNIGLNTEGGTRILSRHLGHLKQKVASSCAKHCAKTLRSTNYH
jgi:alkylated DNA nucleotide flippase Atl1